MPNWRSTAVLVVMSLLLSGACFAGAPPKPPKNPSATTATAISSTQIDVTWVDNSNNEDGFRIERRLGQSGDFGTLDTVGPNVEYYPDVSCNPGTEYCYRVIAYNQDGDSGPSPVACDTTSGSPEPPDAPSGLSATAVMSSTIDLAWTDNSDNEDGFRIQRKVGAGGTFGDLDTVGADETTYQDTSCAAETTYCYRVSAYNGGGDSAWCDEACDTTPSGPAVGHGTYLYHDGQYTQYATAQAAYDAAVPGDEVVYGPGVYAQVLRLNKNGTASDPIVVRGEGKPRPVIDAATITKQQLPASKSPMYVTNDYNVIENLEICHTGKDYGHFANTSGIYYQSGTGLVVRDCFIHDCGHGMYAAAECEEWTLEYNEFCYNGYEGDGFYHNVYNYGWGTNIARYNVFHHSHALGFKNRAQYTEFLYNTVFYNSLYEVDFMLGDSGYGPQDALMMGNWVVKNPNAANYTIFIGFSPRQGGTLTAINNYFQANNPNNTFINIGDEYCVAYNNIFDNNGYSGLEIFFNDSGTATGTNNWMSTTATSAGGLSGSVTGTDPGVADRLNADFHLTAGSQCIDAGANSASPLPDEEPVYPMAWVSRPVDSTIDIGPYEYASYTPVAPLSAEGLTATTQSASSILLEWSNLSDNEDGFAIMRLSDWDVGWEEVDEASAGATSYLDSGLDSGTTYVYRVIAYNSYGDGACSNDAAAATN